MLLRRLARPLLAATFVYGGINALRNTPDHAKATAHLLDRTLGDVSLPEQLPTDPETLVRIDAAVKIGAGTMLALGRFPRLSSAALACSVIPTTFAGHSWWEYEDAGQRTEQQIHFLKNLGLLGGLLISAADTGGKPSVGWRARRRARKAKARTRSAAKTAKRKASKS